MRLLAVHFAHLQKVNRHLISPPRRPSTRPTHSEPLTEGFWGHDGRLLGSGDTGCPFLARRGEFFGPHTRSGRRDLNQPPNNGLGPPPHAPDGISCRPHIPCPLLCQSAARHALLGCARLTFTTTPTRHPPPGHVLKAFGTHGRLTLSEGLVAGPGQVLGRDGVPYPALSRPSGTSSVEKRVSSPTAPPPPDSQFSDHSCHGGGHWCTTHVGAGPPGYGAGLTALWHHVGSI